MSDAQAGTQAGHPSSEHVPDDHEVPGDHVEMHLGPVDWPMWLAGILGVALGLVVVFAMVLATSGVSPAG